MRLIASILILSVCIGVGASPASEIKPNILLIVIDTLRRDHVGCYGYGRDTTPTINRIAAEGVKFQETIATSCWTMPSVMSMFTSVAPSVHKATTYKNRLADGLTTLASELKKGGYQTAGITPNPTTNSKFGFDKGFDFYDDYSVMLSVGVSVLGDKRSGIATSRRATGEDVTRLAVKWLNGKRDRKKPFFLHLLYFDPHYDYLPPAPYDRMFVDKNYEGNQTGLYVKRLKGRKLAEKDEQHLIDLYDGEVRYTDSQIGALIDELKERGLYDSTIIVITSDHGDEFWDHGSVAHGHTLYEELVAVPLVMRFPERIASASVVRDLVSHIDLMPTILSMAGLPIPSQCTGQDLMPLIEGRTERLAERVLIMESEIEGHIRAVRTRDLKVIEREGRREMYALSEDPRERIDLSATARAAEFRLIGEELARIQKLAQSSGEEGEVADNVALSPGLMRQLRSLGYVQ